jgi:putative membrane protein
VEAEVFPEEDQVVLGKVEIEKEITAIEALSDVEVVVAILKSSDEYKVSFYRMILFFVIVLTIISSFVVFDFLYILPLSFAFSFPLAKVQFFKKIFVFKDERIEESGQRAFQIFLESRVHATENRKGLLFFVSVLEKRIIIEQDIEVKFEQSQLSELTQFCATEITNKGLNAAVLNTLAKLKKMVATKHPRIGSNEKKDQVANTLITDF